ncbi:hypothetical protein BGZ60DRAFT_528433 [Tricladium varicosporioides]|nr:hypothetical protein BGZ60DRAFT_528433 [Hymenoscyphus varicosporioides]
MAPHVVSDNSQQQSLTIALRGVCRDYPSGGIIIRELLQNADDAGATVVRFFLDETRHTEKDLIHPELQKYQGPALLAFNNAEFTDRDFQNLRRLGNSLKINDGSTTGKFGLGFSSVYNWTDSPSILSRDRLLILDPHKEWSDGGPVYNFVKDAEDPAMRNQMAAFRAIVENVTEPLDGTVIRIPFRSEKQARKSEISNRPTTTKEVSNILKQFTTDLMDGGLLFMRNVEKLEIRSTHNLSIDIEIVGESIRSHKLQVSNATKSFLKDQAFTFDYSFEAGIKYTSGNKTTLSQFVIHHTIQTGSMDSDVQSWMKENKQVPWVAIAARLPLEDLKVNSNRGTLFTILPLPISSHHPVHIHGSFQLSSDRAKLFHRRDRSLQDRNPGLWNSLLLQELVPLAWVKILAYTATLFPSQPTYSTWPLDIEDPSIELSSALDSLLELIRQDSLPLWYSNVGYKTVQQSLLATGAETNRLRKALNDAGVPVVYVPPSLQQKVSQIFGSQTLSPLSLYQHLKRENYVISSWKNQTKHNILEFMLSEAGFVDFVDLPIFPFEDDMYRSIGCEAVYVHRNDREKDLFRLDICRNLDVARLSINVQNLLIAGCQKPGLLPPSIRYRSASDFNDYCWRHIFPKKLIETDIISLSDEAAIFTKDSWRWLREQQIDVLSTGVCALWLLPLTDGTFRKIKPTDTSSKIVHAPKGDVGDFMRELAEASLQKTSPIVVGTKASALLHVGFGGLEPQSLSLLKDHQNFKPALLIESAENIVHFVSWLNQNCNLINNLPVNIKHQLVALLGQRISKPIANSHGRMVVEDLQPLQIFQKVSWTKEGRNMEPVLEWTTLDSTKQVIAVDGLYAIPSIPDVQFIDVSNMIYAKELLQILRISDCQSIAWIIQKFVVPAWRDGAVTWSNECKQQVAASIFKQYYSLDASTRLSLRTLPFVPVSTISGVKTSRFAAPKSLVDPSCEELKMLFFDEEEAFPDASFSKEFDTGLKACGLKYLLDEELVFSRVQKYANCSHPVDEIRKRASGLLRSTCRWGTSIEIFRNSDVRNLPWLPVTSFDGTPTLKAAIECRGRGDKLLVSSQLPVLDIFISPSWESRLGWDERVPNQILLNQLRFGTESKNKKVIDAVLRYIVHNRQAEELAKELSSIPCILINNGPFVLPSQAFCPTTDAKFICRGLGPYLGNIDHTFWDDHKNLLVRLGIKEKPDAQDLIQLQNQLEQKLPLEDSDVDVAIEVVNIASHFNRDQTIGLKIPTESRTLAPKSNVNYNDHGITTAPPGIILTHPGISPATCQRLGIVPISERITNGELNIQDFEDEDFDQQEKVTTRIADTLDRYRVEATFKEYLANADDARTACGEGATRIDWLLDSRSHPTKHLYTPKLGEYQGPSLLVHNNGVFSEKDFYGFRNVGEGSKAQDRESIGQFGRGSQTMFHFTDVPMILSGETLLILDPQQRSLTINRFRGERRRGVKIPLSKLKTSCPDQLAPFEGLWEYTRNLDSYPGTIFRFPLRSAKSKSTLRSTHRDLDFEESRRLLEAYFDEARISLLFSRNIESISFSVHGQTHSGWSVEKPSNEEDVLSFSKQMVCSFSKQIATDTTISGKDRWWVAIEDLEVATKDLPFIPRRKMKNVECGMAALISTSTSSSSIDSTLRTIKPRLYNVLPLPLSSDLPVHIHATFLLTGDRQSLTLGDSGTDLGESHESGWNNHLLHVALPKLYLSFLEDLGRQVGQDVFKFWPEQNPAINGYSKILCSSFWAKLSECPNRLFPRYRPTRLISGRQKRQQPELYSIDQAIFDFLSDKDSDALTPLLLALDVKLIRHIPTKIAMRLQSLSEVQSVNKSLLQSLSMSHTSRHVIEAQLASGDTTILRVLLAQLMTPNTTLEELDGCQIVPLANGTLGTLRIIDRNPDTQTFFVASDVELNLFNFASDILVREDFNKAFQGVLKTKKFNLKNLRSSDLIKIFSKRPCVSIPNPVVNQWLSSFWEYWNKNIDGFMEISELGTKGTALCRMKCGQNESYVDLKKLEKLPAIIQPEKEAHQHLCSKIPGLHLFDRNFLPISVQEANRSLDAAPSFYRFLCSLNILASNIFMTLGAFVEKHLAQEDLNVFRGLLILHTGNQITSTQFQLKDNPMLFKAVKTIRIWPNCLAIPAQRLIPADGASQADHDFLVPWMKDSHRFIAPTFTRDLANQVCLRELGVERMLSEKLITEHILPLPGTLSGDDWKFYDVLMGAISRVKPKGHLISVLSQSCIASNGSGNLSKANVLFDHTDPIFVAAFRHQSSYRFLREALHRFRAFWLKVGLRHRDNGIINGVDYSQCLGVISQRLAQNDSGQDDRLTADLEEVLSILTRPNSSIQNFNRDTWQSISGELAFPTKTDFDDEPEYRKDFMENLAINQRQLSLSQIISWDHRAVCWSQTPFAVHSPTREVYNSVAGNGEPTIHMIWRHLQHLKDQAQFLSQSQVPSFISDLYCTYSRLQDYVENSKSSFNLRSSAIWLNINEASATSIPLDEILASWQTIDSLVLSSSCDAGALKAVRSGLMPYEKLLRALGCNCITHPTIAQPQLHIGQSVSKSLRGLRESGKLLDATFSTEGRQIQAHKVVLAALSKKCAAQFDPKWPQADIITFTEDEPEDFLSYHTLSTMINYAYEDDVDWSEMEVSRGEEKESKEEKLNMLLDLHKGADIWVIPALASQVEAKIVGVGKEFIDVENVLWVLERAREVRAKAVEKLCEKFIEKNSIAVATAHPTS